MLMFQPPNTHKLFREQFPVVWSECALSLCRSSHYSYENTEVITFRAHGHDTATIQYNARLGFAYSITVSFIFVVI